MRPPEALQVVPIHFPRRRPAFGTSEDDHRPARPECLARLACLLLDLADLQGAMFHGGSHCLMSIGALSKQSGVDIETIRYYERIGVMPSPKRNAGGYRIFGPDHL